MSNSSRIASETYYLAYDGYDERKLAARAFLIDYYGPRVDDLPEHVKGYEAEIRRVKERAKQ